MKFHDNDLRKEFIPNDGHYPLNSNRPMLYMERISTKGTGQGQEYFNSIVNNLWQYLVTFYHVFP